MVAAAKSFNPNISDSELAEITKEQSRRRQLDSEPYIQPANKIIVTAFGVCQQYWVWAGLGQRVSLDIVQCVARIERTAFWRLASDSMRDQIITGIEHIAIGALNVLNNKDQK